ncbi:MAG: indolepyruvate ferredoxin oxidoreductase subunit alpha [bacterium]
MNSELLLGDEAVARGAWEAGCSVAAAYPGTPSTEILETLARYKDVYCEWSVNEKVALEVAIGAAIAGVRSLAAMKHVGLNVAADPLFSAAYIGVNAGLVIVSADDPGLHSSQNEQDNRFYGFAAKIPVLCPADSQDAKEFTKLSFDLSEQFDIPILLRLTTRVAHSSSIVTLDKRIEVASRGYQKQISKTTLLPIYARVRHIDLENRIIRLQKYSETSSLNRIELGNAELGIICDGVAYQYAREVFPEASFLKLGMVYPFPNQLVLNFAQKVKNLVVIEEGDPFIELQTRALGLHVKGKDFLPRWGELNVGIIRHALTEKIDKPQPEEDLPPRPPALCPGCPHLGLFFALQKQKAVIAGDIGCYTLAALPPHSAMDTCIDMGASITFAHGADKALGNTDPRPRIAILGDSTFFHSGITGLINTTYNDSSVITIIADNRTTGMTGHQNHPGTGITLKGKQTKMIDIELLCRACGISHVVHVDPYHPRETRKTINELLKKKENAVVISQRPCALLVGKLAEPKTVNLEKCNGCRSCLALGCPAISFIDNKAFIVATSCTGCGMCVEICPREAIG